MERSLWKLAGSAMLAALVLVPTAARAQAASGSLERRDCEAFEAYLQVRMESLRSAIARKDRAEALAIETKIHTEECRFLTRMAWTARQGGRAEAASTLEDFLGGYKDLTAEQSLVSRHRSGGRSPAYRLAAGQMMADGMASETAATPTPWVPVDGPPSPVAAAVDTGATPAVGTAASASKVPPAPLASVIRPPGDAPPVAAELVPLSRVRAARLADLGLSEQDAPRLAGRRAPVPSVAPAAEARPATLDDVTERGTARASGIRPARSSGSTHRNTSETSGRLWFNTRNR